MKVFARLLLILVLIFAFVYSFLIIDNTAKNTASYLEEQTAFAYNNSRLVIMNKEINLP